MNSVIDLETAVNATFYSILNEIQLSNLNFKIQVTPFAAHITLKKSALLDRNGNHAIPSPLSPPILYLLEKAQQEIFMLREENSQLKAALCDSNNEKCSA